MVDSRYVGSNTPNTDGVEQPDSEKGRERPRKRPGKGREESGLSTAALVGCAVFVNLTCSKTILSRHYTAAVASGAFPKNVRPKSTIFCRGSVFWLSLSEIYKLTRRSKTEVDISQKTNGDNRLVLEAFYVFSFS